MNNRPCLVYADAEGRIFEWQKLAMAGARGRVHKPVEPGEWIPLPPGSELFLLPDRMPVGYNLTSRQCEILARDPYHPAKPVRAVAAFVSQPIPRSTPPPIRLCPGLPSCRFSLTPRSAG